jgi:hypothetical protein
MYTACAQPGLLHPRKKCYRYRAAAAMIFSKTYRYRTAAATIFFQNLPLPRRSRDDFFQNLPQPRRHGHLWFGLISIIHPKINQLRDVVWINIDYSSKNRPSD